MLLARGDRAVVMSGASTPPRSRARSCSGSPRRAPQAAARIDARHVRRPCRASTSSCRPAGASRCVADAASGLHFPRRILEVAPGRFWIVDMGGWEPSRGRLLQFELPSTARAPVDDEGHRRQARSPARPRARARRPRLSRRGRPHLAHAAALPVASETVLDGLPADGAHPLKEIAFGAPGQLFVNVGSSSDACRDDANALPMPCPDLVGSKPRAAVYEAVLGGAGFDACSRSSRMRPACATRSRSPGSRPALLLQGENSIDYRDEDAPAEELNALRAGANYGWPYCVGARQVARGYEGRFDCATTEAPALLWPAHVAPLQMLAVPADAGNAFAGQLARRLARLSRGRPSHRRLRARRATADRARRRRSGSTVGRRAPAAHPLGAPSRRLRRLGRAAPDRRGPQSHAADADARRRAAAPTATIR